MIKVLTTGMGETASDFLAHAVPPVVAYLVSTVFFSGVLAAVFVIWYRVEGTLSIHRIDTRRREFFYWSTVLVTFALGTAAGDLTATTLGWGYLASGIVFAVAIAVPAVAHRRFGLAAIPAFWIAYVITRPLGVSFADWMGVSHARHGLGWGTGPVTLGWLAAIVGLVGFLTVTRTDAELVEIEARLAELPDVG